MIKVGIRDISSKLFAKSALNNPSKAKSIAERNTKSIAKAMCATWISVINAAAVNTNPATISARKSAHVQNPTSIFHVAIGDTNSSSIDFWNFAPKKLPDVFWYAAIITAIIKSPGNIKSM